MENKTVWVIAGTSDGRLLVNELVKMGVNVVVSVATDYGAGILQPIVDCEVAVGRMDVEQMTEFIQQHSPVLTVDATHPYAELVSANIAQACQNANTPLLRLYRQKNLNTTQSVLYKDDMQQAVEFLNTTQGNILLTTGSKDLDKFCLVDDYAERIYVRILPMLESLGKALELGYKPAHIICMQGPFSENMNVAMLQDYKIKYMVSKDSGKVGGLEEKISAVETCNSNLVLIGRPQTETVGYEIGDIIEKIRGMM